MADVEESSAQTELQSRHVVYCGVCSLPPEYCEYGGTVKKCQEWLEKKYPDMYERLWSEDALAAATSTLSVDAQKRAAKDATKKAAKAEALEAKQNETLASSKIRIKRVERNKRKYVTEIQGLEAFGLELKKVAKEFGSKFATGSSVTKVASGGQEITVQGDVSEDVREFLIKTYKNIPRKNIVLEEPKKKKAEPAEV
ncbi:05acb5e6-214c-446f-a369-b6ad4feab107 [Sclerotinia trifoliorum]|uniref:Translation machinery-associated protein 22 n=1 Tax=Sclerotinia trifoliorum TaxID=28548 RepID=A0A8H2W3F9_9HELO|nr:05acb5e6-214c-446f-a369-b6ad4feab107 [Sclerotinia trifoliorum]